MPGPRSDGGTSRGWLKLPLGRMICPDGGSWGCSGGPISAECFHLALEILDMLQKHSVVGGLAYTLRRRRRRSLRAAAFNSPSGCPAKMACMLGDSQLGQMLRMKSSGTSGARL